jgi:predicted nucleotidyltransferase
MITFKSRNFISNIPSLPRNLVLKGSVSHKEFKAYIDKSIVKNSNFLTYLLGHLEMDSASIHRLKSYFTAQNSAYFIKYCPFCKILVFPKTLLSPKWSKPLGFDIEKMNNLASDLYFLVVFNRSVLNSGKYPRPNFINPIPQFSLNQLKPQVLLPNKQQNPQNNLIKSQKQMNQNPNQIKQHNLERYQDYEEEQYKDQTYKKIQQQTVYKGTSLLNVLKLGN